MSKNEKFSWTDSCGDASYDEVLLIKWIMDIGNPDVIVRAQVLRNNISNTNSAKLNNKIPKMLKHVKKTMDLIRDLGENHDNLLEDTFNALLSAPNSHFVDFFDKEKLTWQARKKMHTFNTLSEVAKTIYNNIQINQSWDSLDPKDAKILSLTTPVQQLTKPALVTQVDQHPKLEDAA